MVARPAQTIGLGVLSASASVRTFDFNDADLSIFEMAAQTDAIGAGSFDAGEDEMVEAKHPLDQFAVAAAIRLELPTTEHAADRVDHRGVVCVPVGVDSADDIDDGLGHVDVPFLWMAMRRPGGRTRQ